MLTIGGAGSQTGSVRQLRYAKKTGTFGWGSSSCSGNWRPYVALPLQLEQ
jgi:hypothetical protein